MLSISHAKSITIWISVYHSIGLVGHTQGFDCISSFLLTWGMGYVTCFGKSHVDINIVEPTGPSFCHLGYTKFINWNEIPYTQCHRPILTLSKSHLSLIAKLCHLELKSKVQFGLSYCPNHEQVLWCLAIGPWSTVLLIEGISTKPLWSWNRFCDWFILAFMSWMTMAKSKAS